MKNEDEMLDKLLEKTKSGKLIWEPDIFRRQKTLTCWHNGKGLLVYKQELHIIDNTKTVIYSFKFNSKIEELYNWLMKPSADIEEWMKEFLKAFLKA